MPRLLPAIRATTTSRAVHTLGAGNLPLVNELVTKLRPTEPDPFDTVRLVVEAIAAARG